MQLEDTRTMSALRASATALEASVPGFISVKDLARGDGLFFGPGRAVRRELGALVALSVLALIGAGTATVLHISVAREFLPAAAVAALGFAALWFFASLLRLRPARVCYIRAQPKLGAGRFTSELRPYGHVIVYRAGGRGADVRSVASRLRNRFALNLRALCSDQQTLTLNAAPEVTQLLAHSSDVLIVDLSSGRPADWDMIQGEAARCVFVSAWGQHEQAETAFAGLSLPGQCFFYAPDGEIQRRSQFRAAMLAAMRAAHAA